MSEQFRIDSGSAERASTDAKESLANILKDRAQEQAKPAVRLARHVVSSAKGAVPAGAQPAREKSDAAFQVSVLNGKHVGATARIKKKPFTVGSDFSCDVIITDASVAAAHLLVTPGNGLLNTVSVKATGPGVLVADEAVEENSEITAYLPVDMSIGDVRVRLSSNESAVKHKFFGKKILAAAVIGTTAALAWPLVSSLSTDITSTFSGAIGEVDRMIAGSDKRAFTNANAIIDEAGLAGSITIAPHGSGLIAKGIISPAKHAQWAEIKRKLVADGVAIVDQVHSSSVGEPSRANIAAIALGANPHVITNMGRTVKIGEALEGGWVIKELKSNTVVVERGSVRTVITP